MKKITVGLIATLALLLGGATEAYADPPVSNATVKGVQSFPSTDGHGALVVLGMGLLASGVVLLRRPAVVPKP